MAEKEGSLPPVQLQHSLGVPHLVALAVGGAIASGFLLFVGQAIAIAGPAVLISYLIGGVILVAVMACLTELVITKPRASFATYARDAMGPLAGFLTGWNYWLAWVMGVATESVAAGTYLKRAIWMTAVRDFLAHDLVVTLAGCHQIWPGVDLSLP